MSMAFDETVIGRDFGPFPFEYDWKDAALYALASGATVRELDLLLETRGPKVLPTYAVVVAFEALLAALSKLGGTVGTLVHGGQRCVVDRPLPSAAKVFTTCRVTGLYDKGTSALAVFDAETVDLAGDRLAHTEWRMFYRGAGGFGGPRGPDSEPASSPPSCGASAVSQASLSPSSSSPSSSSSSSSSSQSFQSFPGASVQEASVLESVSMTTQDTQALLYRLASGDLNPLHADPAFAAAVGFERPILHGLCTLAHAARAIIRARCAGDADRLRMIEGRFSKPVLPGQTITTDVLRVGDGAVDYVTRVGDIAVITHGHAEYVVEPA
ncbi:MAG: MaoC family dehydratase N-terminal domain-containing protein [Deltaproteobacteria bacterium]|nr:MaoC family dehydratase N-terminal domain-containing protein [Deltaproteobacteria bacterium]